MKKEEDEPQNFDLVLQLWNKCKIFIEVTVIDLVWFPLSLTHNTHTRSVCVSEPTLYISAQLTNHFELQQYIYSSPNLQNWETLWDRVSTYSLKWRVVDTRASAGHRSRPGCGNHLKGFVFLFDEGSGDHTIIVEKSKWVAKLEDRQDFGHVSTVQDNTNLENDIISSITQLMTSLRQRHTLSLSLFVRRISVRRCSRT